MKVRGICQRARHFLLHRHVAVGIAGLFEIGPIVVRIPEPRDARELPRAVLERPGQRGGLVAMKYRAAGPWRYAARGEQDTVANCGHGLLRVKEIDTQSAEASRFRGIRACRARDARPATATRQRRSRQPHPNEAARHNFDPQSSPHRRRARHGWPASEARPAAACATAERRPRNRVPSPDIIMSSAAAGWPSGVAKLIVWPALTSTSQLTAASLGSKSRAGKRMRTRAIATYTRKTVEPVVLRAARSA